MTGIGTVWGWRIALAAAVMALPSVGPASMALADEVKLDIPELIRDTQRVSSAPDRVRLVWWIPTEFWKVTLARNKNITKAQVQEFLNVVRQHTIIVVVDGKRGRFGRITFTPTEALRNSVKLAATDGKTYRPLAEDKIDADTKNLISMIKAATSNLIGPMGKNMNCFMFPAKNAKGQRMCDPKAEGFFWVHLGKDKFRWRLPLGSLLPKKTCSKCDEKLNGAYKYCPWCGTKLPEAKPTRTPKPAPKTHGEDQTGKPAGLPRSGPSRTAPPIPVAPRARSLDQRGRPEPVGGTPGSSSTAAPTPISSFTRG